MLLLILGTFTGAYPLMYFAQEFIPLKAAIFISSAIVILVIAARSVTMMGFSLTLMAAIHTRLQGILISGAGIALFIVAMLLIPRLKLGKMAGPSPIGASPVVS